MAEFITYTLAREVAEDVYPDAAKHYPDGWELDTSFGTGGELTGSDGFFAYALKPTAANTAVPANTRILAFRGTQMDSASDLYTDAKDIGYNSFALEASKIDDWLGSAIASGNSVELVGHSLGGALVQWTINSDNLAQITTAVQAHSGNNPAPDVLAHLQFKTFNAPGITYSPGSGTDQPRGSPVSGTHYVLAYQPKYGVLYIGDPVHLLGGPPVGGKLVALDAPTAGPFAHSIKNDTGLWDYPYQVLSGYSPSYGFDAEASQQFGRAIEKLFGVDGQPSGDLVAAEKLTLILSWAGARKVAPFNPFLAADLAIGGTIPILVDKLLTPGMQGLIDGLAYLRDQAVAKGVNAIDYSIQLASSVYDTVSHRLGESEAQLASLVNQLSAFLVDTAKGVANAFSDLTTKFADATFNLAQSLGLPAYRPYAAAFDAALGGGSNAVSGALVDAVKQAQDIVDTGGQSVAIVAGIAGNPFDNPGFDPNAVSIGLKLKQYSAKTLTLYLPFAAGAKGQKIHLQLSGTAVASLALVDGQQGRVQLDSTGGFDLAVGAGERQVTFSLVVEGQVKQDDTLALSAALVDANGQQTHPLYQQVSLLVQGGDDSGTQPGPTPVFTPLAGVSTTDTVDGAARTYTKYTGDDANNYLVTTDNGLNYVHLGAGNNSVIGGTGSDTVYAGGGNNTIKGGGGEDWIMADGSGDNLITANGGSDIIYAGYGHNRIYAGAEVDLADAIRNAQTATPTGQRGNFIATGAGTVVAGNGNDAIVLGSGNQVVVAGPGNDTIAAGYVVGGVTKDWRVVQTPGTDRWDVLFDHMFISSTGDYVASPDYQGQFDQDGKPLGAGSTTIFGGSGELLVALANGQNYVQLAAGDGRVYGGNESDTILGGSGTSTIIANGGDDYIVAGSGLSYIFGDRGNNVIMGGSGKAVIYANDKVANWADLNQGNNFVQAGSGDAIIYGSGGNDTLLGGSGNDQIHAGNGNTTINGGTGSDSIWGGAGADLIYTGDGGTASAPVQVLAGSGQTTVHGGAGVDLIQGGSGDNVLYAGDGGTADGPTTVQAGAGNTTIYGGAGVDLLIGGAGTDVLYAGDGGDAAAPTVLEAGSGDNTLVAGSGYSVLMGGTGTTHFVLNPANGNTVIANAKSTDTIDFGDGTLPSDMAVTAQLYANGDSALVLGAGNEAVTLMNGLTGTAGQFQFGASTVSLQQLMQQAQVTPQHFVSATGELGFTVESGETLTASTSNSKLYAFGDHSTLTVGAGTHTLGGGGGNDTYVISSADVKATITNTLASDTLAFGAGISAGSIQATWTPAAGGSGGVTLALEGGGHVELQGILANMPAIKFADGSSTTLEQLVLATGGVPLPGYGTSKVADDGHGNVVTTWLDNSGTKISDTWTKADGSSGSDVFNADGSSSGKVKYADGTTGTVADDGKGTVTTKNFDAHGVLSGSNIKSVTSQGQTITYFDAAGVKLSDSWTRTDGTHGTDTFGSDGSSVGTSSGYPDGSTVTRTDDGHGNIMSQFTFNGVKVRDVWTKADGSTGRDTFNADGSSSGFTFYPDGGYATDTNDGHGAVETITYDVKGNVIADTLNGQPKGTQLNNADGSYSITTDGGHGNVTTTFYDSRGVVYHVNWARSDSTRGDDYFNQDGSGSGSTYQADGAYSTYNRSAEGQTTTKNYDWSGSLTGTTYRKQDGQNNVITAYRDRSNNKFSETWTHSDGASGTDSIDPIDFLGRSALMKLPQWYSPGWSLPGVSGQVYVNGSAELYLNVSSFSGVEGSRLESEAWKQPSYGSVGYGWWDDGLARIEFQYQLNSDGGRDVWADSYDNSVRQYYTVGVGQGLSFKVTTHGINVVYSDDGQGNLTITDFAADGKKLADMWAHNDGSFGFDSFNADGSSTGVAGDIAGHGTLYTSDGHGQVSVSALAPLPVPATNNAAALLALSQAPGWNGVPVAPIGSGLWTNPTMASISDGKGGTYVMSFSYTGGVTSTHLDQYGKYIAEGSVDTDPGYGTAVMVNGKKLGWKYDVNGKPVNSYVDDMNGTVTRYTYDSTGKTVGYTVEVTDSQGKGAISRYDAAGRLTGTSVQVTTADGVVTTNSFDAAGQATGSTVSKADGKGNSVSYSFDAAGRLAGSRTTVVTNANEVTITTYDGQGKALGAYVTRIASDGTIYTSNYGASGALTGSVVAHPDASGNFATSNYDAQGKLTSYVTMSADGKTVTAYGAGGIKEMGTSIAADSTLVSTDSLPDGSQVVTKRNADRTYSTTVTTAQGDVTTTSYNALGAKLSDTWTRSDNTSGTDTFNADGTASGTVKYPDNSSSRYTKDLQGKITATHYDLYGTVKGSTVTTNANGTVETDYYNTAGKKTSDVWSKADGSSGADTYPSNGGRVATVNDGHGGTISTTYNASGAKIGAGWSTVDGTKGSTTFNADGSYVTTVTDPAGNWVTTNYNKAGLRLTDTWKKVDGSSGSDTFNSDGSYTGTENDGDGTLSTTRYDAYGTALDDSWTYTDGSHGTDTYNSDGSWVGTTYETDGSIRIVTVQADGNYSVYDKDKLGNTSTEQYNENYFMLSRHWQKTDGTSGDDTFTAPDATPQVAHTLPNRTAKVGGSFAFTVPADTFVEKVAGDTLTYKISVVNGGTLPAWLTFDPVTRKLSGTAPSADERPVRLKITATDQNGLRASTTFVLSVGTVVGGTPEVNKPIADVAADELKPLSFIIPADTFADPDAASPLTYGAKLESGDPLPAWLKFDAATGTFSGMPPDDSVGTPIRIVLTATDIDSGESTASTFALNVKALDTLFTDVSMVLPAHVRNLTATGTADLTLTGNALSHTLTANGGNDTLVAGSGLATLVGGVGNDVFVVNNPGDVVVAQPGHGINKVLASVNFVLPENVQELAATGDAPLTLTGSASPGTLRANSAGDTLVAGAGITTMYGGAGNDTFVVNHAGDVIVEQANAGINTVLSSVDFVLPANLQNLSGTGSAAIRLTGNGLANVITANGGGDTLVAGTGIATMYGGAGNDTFVVNNSADVIVEQANGGVNTVLSSVDYVLPAHVQNLTGSGSAAITLTGNDLANVLTANDGNDTLVAGSGAATLVGGAGNTTFVINSTLDVVQAKAGGINTVQTAVSYTASANVRNVTGTGVANVTLAGNDLDNVITANGGNDTLVAGAGNDTLVSGAGNDLLVGGAGNTTFAYGLGDGMDTLQAGTGTSTVRFGAGIALGNAVIRLTNADGSPCEMVADGGTIHAANPTGASQALSAHLVLLDEHGVVQPGQGMGFTVTMDAKGNITSPISSFHFADGSAAAFTDLLATSQTLRGSDTKGTIATGHNDDVIYAGPYTTEIQLGSGNNTVYGGPQGTLVRGGGGVDHFIGGQGNDTFAGGWGVSVVQGVQGNGNFTAANGPAVLMGGRYGDVLTGGAGNDFLAGGAGDDTITTGSAGAVVAFNKGDGQDTLHLGTGAATLSLGGGISEADLTFTRKGDDLVLGTGSGGAITLAGWYGGTGQHNQLTLQMVEAASKTYDPASSDQLVNRKVETFDFGQLVQQFDAARAANPQLTSWSLMDGLLSAHLAGSDSAALGGDLAFYYGANGNLSGLDLDVAVTTVRDSRFGKSAQGIDNWSGVSRGGDALR